MITRINLHYKKFHEQSVNYLTAHPEYLLCSCFYISNIIKNKYL